MSGRKQKFRERNGIQVTNEVSPVSQPNVPERKQSPIKYILEQQKFRFRQDLATLRIAREAAENIINYDREYLHRIYTEILRDPTVTSNWESRKMKTKQREFKIMTPAGEEDIERTKLLEAPWFNAYMDAVLDSRLRGFNLIEFGDLVEGEFKPFRVGKKIHDAVTIVQPDNVKPEYGVVVNIPGAYEGLAFDDPRFDNHLMFIGEAHDLGLLFKCAKYVLLKDNCLANWSEWAEVFGMDKRVGFTNAMDTPESPDRTNFIRAIRDMGANAYGVFSEDDRVEYIGTNRTDAFGVYKELISYADSQIAKLLYGQDVVQNNTGQVTGKVGENVSEMYGASDGKFMKYHVNCVLIPFMEKLGYDWGGSIFQWDSTEKIPLKDRIVQDNYLNTMGWKFSQQYITDTYGVDVEEKPEPDPTPVMNPKDISKQLKNMYNV